MLCPNFALVTKKSLFSNDLSINITLLKEMLAFSLFNYFIIANLSLQIMEFVFLLVEDLREHFSLHLGYNPDPVGSNEICLKMNCVLLLMFLPETVLFVVVLCQLFLLVSYRRTRYSVFSREKVRLFYLAQFYN